MTVLSTIHAKSVAGVYERLLTLGVDKSELDNALQGIAYMRLIMRVIDDENGAIVNQLEPTVGRLG